MVNPAVALSLVLRSRPSTPAIEEARRISLERQASGTAPGIARMLSNGELAEPLNIRDRSSRSGADRGVARRNSRGETGSGRSVTPLRSSSLGRSASAGHASSGGHAPTTHPAPITHPAPTTHRATALSGTTKSIAASRQNVGSPRTRGGTTSNPANPVSPANLLRSHAPVTTNRSAMPISSRSLATGGTSGNDRGSTSRLIATSPASSWTGPAMGSAATARAPLPELREHTNDDQTVLRKSRLASVPEQTTSRPIAAVTGTVAGVILLVVAFTSVGLHGKLAKNQIVLDQTRVDISVQERANQRLRVEVAELQAPQRIVAEAEKMGMVPSAEVEFLDSSSSSADTAVTVPPTGTSSSAN